jgi:proteasome lid subunit RPN8/RPN11
VVLQLTPDHLNAIHQHAESTYPSECCGLLLGKRFCHQAQDLKAIFEVWPAENAWTLEAENCLGEAESSHSERTLSQTSRYWIAPEFLLTAQRYCRDRDLDIMSIYHSHPDHPAVPSECDRVNAWPEYSYLIIAVKQGIAQDYQSWCLDTHHIFQPERVWIGDQSHHLGSLSP